MKLTPPKEITFWIAVILGALGLIVQMGVITTLGIASFWLAFAGLVLLAIALMVKGL